MARINDMRTTAERIAESQLKKGLLASNWRWKKLHGSEFQVGLPDMLIWYESVCVYTAELKADKRPLEGAQIEIISSMGSVGLVARWCGHGFHQEHDRDLWHFHRVHRDHGEINYTERRLTANPVPSLLFGCVGAYLVCPHLLDRLRTLMPAGQPTLESFVLDEPTLHAPVPRVPLVDRLA